VIHQIRRSAIVARSDAKMFALVNDVEAYPRRFAWCAGSRVTERSSKALTARLEVRIAGMVQAFTTRNTLDPPRAIDMQLVDGPFRSLAGGWTFTALGDTGCRVALALDFEYAGVLLAPIMRAGFQKLADRMVDEFCREAEHGLD
jgi:ribosome-associated toxin RatA of RatAB toxin-antitoxin module